MDDKFTSRVATPGATADPSKHVNYSFGMVLGVDDFTQDFVYHSARDQWMMRDAVGYGTLSGLAVTQGPSGADTEIRVSPGTALTPRGQLVCVSPLQCANLNKWVASEKHRDEIKKIVGSPPARPLTLYLVLCYRDCPTDRVPIPGEPCRTEEEATAPSRLKDDFKLELRFEPPPQTEEDALRDFVKWLNEHLSFTDEGGPYTDLAAFLAALRAAAADPASPPSPPDFMTDSPPHLMRVHAADACRFLRAAFRLWVTELRPLWRPAGFSAYTGCGGESAARPDDDCLLLAQLTVTLDAAGALDPSHPVVIDEERRPYVVHLRMLQEWLTCGALAPAQGFAPFPPFDESPPAPPAAGQVLPFVTILRTSESDPTFRFWFHLEAPGGHASVSSFPDAALKVFGELDAPDIGGSLLAPISFSLGAAGGRLNLFDVKLDMKTDVARFVFDLKNMKVQTKSGAHVLADYAKARGVRFVGQGDADTVTAFAPLILV